MNPSAGKRLRPHVRPAVDSTRGLRSPGALPRPRVAWGSVPAAPEVGRSGSGVVSATPRSNLPVAGRGRDRGVRPPVSLGRRGARESLRRYDWMGARPRRASSDRRRVLSLDVSSRRRDPPRSGRHLNRPVLKHGPRSLTRARVRRTCNPKGAGKAKAGSPASAGAHRQPLRWLEGARARALGPERWLKPEETLAIPETVPETRSRGD